VWLLKKAVYGLKQAARARHKRLTAIMTAIGFAACQVENCIFKHSTKSILMGAYVDDLIVIGKQDDIEWLKSELSKNLSITDKGLIQHCLSMQIEYDHRTRSWANSSDDLL